MCGSERFCLDPIALTGLIPDIVAACFFSFYAFLLLRSGPGYLPGQKLVPGEYQAVYLPL